MSQDWDIRPCGDACGTCGVSFRDRQPYFSRLVAGGGGYERRDYCEECWAKPEVKALDPHSAWKGLYRLPPPPAEETLRKETAESLLRKFMETDDPSKRRVIYVLAAMLERKKLLVERQTETRADGARIIVYEYRKTGEVFLVPDPDLRLNQLESVQAEVASLLGGPPPTGSADAAPPSGPVSLAPA